jgi:hypothetical protein
MLLGLASKQDPIGIEPGCRTRPKNSNAIMYGCEPHPIAKKYLFEVKKKNQFFLKVFLKHKN